MNISAARAQNAPALFPFVDMECSFGSPICFTASYKRWPVKACASAYSPPRLCAESALADADGKARPMRFLQNRILFVLSLPFLGRRQAQSTSRQDALASGAAHFGPDAEAAEAARLGKLKPRKNAVHGFGFSPKAQTPLRACSSRSPATARMSARGASRPSRQGVSAQTCILSRATRKVYGDRCFFSRSTSSSACTNRMSAVPLKM